MDGTIPRKALPAVLARLREFESEFGLRVANVFHAGDGNLHPLILFDANVPGELERAEAFGAAILRLCVQVGGVLTGEHGVGVEKRDLMSEQFTEADLAHQQRLKCAFDPDGLLNPGKVFPVLHRCAELGRMHVHRRQAAARGSAALLRTPTLQHCVPAMRTRSPTRSSVGASPRSARCASWGSGRSRGSAIRCMAPARSRLSALVGNRQL